MAIFSVQTSLKMSAQFFGPGKYFQIGGIGEGNLPRKRLMEIEEDQLKICLRRAKANVGYFQDSGKKR